MGFEPVAGTGPYKVASASERGIRYVRNTFFRERSHAAQPDGNRRELVRLYGGRDLARPTCQVLPPGLPGYRPYCPYTRNPTRAGAWSGPDLARAKRLVATAAWGDTTHGMFATWFACNGPAGHGWFCDPALDRRLHGIDRSLVDRAAWAPMVNELGLAFVSARLRNYQFHPYWGLIADQLWMASPGDTGRSR